MNTVNTTSVKPETTGYCYTVNTANSLGMIADNPFRGDFVKSPSQYLVEMLQQNVTLIISDEHFYGKLVAFDQTTYVVENEEGVFVVNRNAIDMLFLTPEA